MHFTEVCGSISSSDHSCYVLDGKISIYFEGSKESMESNIMLEIKNGMNDGKLLDAHTSIKRITFLERNDSRVIKSEDDATPPASAWTPGYVSVLAIGSAIVLSSILCARCVGSSQNDDSSESDIESEDWQVESNWLEESNNSSLNYLSDDETRTKYINIDIEIQQMITHEDMEEDFPEDTFEVNVDLNLASEGEFQNPVM